MKLGIIYKHKEQRKNRNKETIEFSNGPTIDFSEGLPESENWFSYD